MGLFSFKSQLTRRVHLRFDSNFREKAYDAIKPRVLFVWCVCVCPPPSPRVQWRTELREDIDCLNLNVCNKYVFIIYVSAFLYTYKCVRMCVCVWIYVYIPMYRCVCICIFVYICIYPYIYMYAYIYMYIYISVYVQVYKHIYGYILMCMHTYDT